MQRVWLTASALGLAAQPFGGVPFLLTRMLRAGSDGFSESQYALLRSTYRDLQQMVPVQDENGLIILFRIGTAADPSERSIRRPLTDVATFTF